jgi:hypothetical protein
VDAAGSCGPLSCSGSLAAVALGAALVTAATTTALSRVDERTAGAASGTVNTAHELGAAIGVAAAAAIAGVGTSLGVGAANFGTALEVGSATAAGPAALMLWLVPRGPLPATDGPASCTDYAAPHGTSLQARRHTHPRVALTEIGRTAEVNIVDIANVANVAVVTAPPTTSVPAVNADRTGCAHR